MSISPQAYVDSLRIGTVDFVSPDEIKVMLEIEAPDRVALNTGTPRPFPRINGYVLIPSDDGFLVAQVEWITVERSQYPKRRGMQDFGLVDLPYPLRKMSLNPLGVLKYDDKNSKGEDCYRFYRGVESYPTVGDSVLLPTQVQLKSIVESGEKRRVKIGTSPLAANADVCIDPDRLFGRHLAVLGNTGSGKSCSVAGLIRWSLEAAERKRKEQGSGSKPNARFIVLDPNGEYANTFKGLTDVRVYGVEAGQDVAQLQVPIWLWNTAEWSAFTQASAKTQKPLLVQALRSVRDGVFESAVTSSREMRRYLRTLLVAVKTDQNGGTPWKGPGPAKGFRNRLVSWEDGLEMDDSFSPDETSYLRALKINISALLETRRGEWPSIFTRSEIQTLLDCLSVAHSAFGGSDTDVLPIDADIPREFTGDQFLRSIEANAELSGVSEYVETLLMRIRTILADSRMKVVAGDAQGVSLDDWLCNYIGDSESSNGSITVVDLSLVPAEVVHIITAVISRMTLEALQRYRKHHPKGRTLPTVLVMEEAHTFIKRYRDDAENQSSASMCCQVFEKIAREGRKFGLGLVLSSQRPSELSPTVLSQCNSYLLHRISNDKDQELVHKLVPDNLRGLLRDLPSLPSQHAVLLGWASELPVLVQMNNLPDGQRPKSDDPDFWSVWSGEGLDVDDSGQLNERRVDWKVIADDWQQKSCTEDD